MVVAVSHSAAMASEIAADGSVSSVGAAAATPTTVVSDYGFGATGASSSAAPGAISFLAEASKLRSTFVCCRCKLQKPSAQLSKTRSSECTADANSYTSLTVRWKTDRKLRAGLQKSS